MKRLVILLLGVIVGATAWAGGDTETQTAPGSAAAQVAVMDGFSSGSAAGVTVQWKVEGESITIHMSAPTTGWIAVGFDPSRQMADANIVIGYVKDGQVFLRDDFGTGNIRHGADVDNGGASHLSNVRGEEANGTTAITFTIPLDSGDATDTVLVPGGTHKVIVAHGPNGADDYGTYHGSRGSFSATL